MHIWGKGHLKSSKKVPQVRYVHFPQMFTSGHWGKWALWVNAHLGERGTPCPKGVPPSALCPFTSNVYKWALGKMGTWGKCTFGRKGYPMPQSALCLFTSNVYEWALGQMSFWAKCAFGGKGYPTCPKSEPQVLYAHFLQMFTNGHWGKGTFGEKGTPSVLYSFPKIFLNGQ